MLPTETADIKREAAGQWSRILPYLVPEVAEPVQSGRHIHCPLPDHLDRNPSFRWDDAKECSFCTCEAGKGADGWELLKLLRGWTFAEAVREVAEYLGLTRPKTNGKAKKPGKVYPTLEGALAALGTVVDHWPYHDAAGKVVMAVARLEPKSFRPLHCCPGGWAIGDPPGKLPLFNLPAVAAADRILVVEGEKAASIANRIGMVATTSCHGAAAARKTDWAPAAGKELMIWPDNDPEGERYGNDVVAIARGLDPPATVQVIKMDGLPEKGDIADWIEQRNGASDEQLRAEIENSKSAFPRQKDLARIEFCPIPASQLGGSEEVDFLWSGYLARGFVTLMVGLWKAGKSTLLSWLLRAMADGGELAGHVSKQRAVVITEEGSGLWARRRDDVGLGDHAHFDIRPFKSRPKQSEWSEYLGQVAAAVRRGDYDAVIIDTWSAVNPCVDENDAAATTAACLPLLEITEAGAGILLVHHPKKGDGAEGQAARGSGALAGFVDTIVELRRFKPSDADDRRRKLRGLSRFEETPNELVIELGPEGYRQIGSTGDANRQDRQRVIDQLLTEDDWKSVTDLLEEWPEEGKPSKRTLQMDLKHGAEQGTWSVAGKGTKGDPYRYKFDSRKVHLSKETRESNCG